MKKLSEVLTRYGIITAAAPSTRSALTGASTPTTSAWAALPGIAQIINHYLPQLPIGTLALVMNIPLFILGWKKIGKALLFSSLYATAVSSVMIDALAAVHTFQPMDPILACLYGGAICGVAFGVMLRQGATTGGTELAARLLKLKFESISIGTLCLMIDVLVTFGYALIFRDMTRALYGVIALYVSSLLMDKVVYGPNAAKMAYIISERSEEITQKLLELDRGVTLLDGHGAWSGRRKDVILCAFGRATSYRSKSSCRRSTRTPSSSSCDAHEILGEGFRHLHAGGL